MGASAPWGHRTTGHLQERHGRDSEVAPTGYVGWSWGLIALTLPAALAAVLAVSVLEQLAGTAPAWGGGLVYVAVLAPLVASIVVGVRGWRREHQMLALRAAALSALLAVAGTVMVVLA
ncbi:MAG TPA: hypothetical protein VLB29_08155 [Nocardioidaceae bacterium]|nr:hypothetical protein [Nocardioidaceae bacterium]